MQALSKKELLRVLAAARARRERDWLLFLVTYNHGLRVSEVIALTRDDLEDGFLDVRRLKGSERTVQPLVSHEKPLLSESPAIIEYSARMHGNQRLFPISRRQVDHLFKKYCAAAGIPKHKAHVHVLKHTCGMQLLGPAGINATQRWLGHKNGASTLRYLGLTDEEAAPRCVAALSV